MANIEQELGCVDIISSLMRSVDKTLRMLAGIAMTEIPVLTKTSTINEVITGSRPDMLVSIMQFYRLVGNDEKKYTALCIVTIPKRTCELLFKPMGIFWNSPEEELKDACGEYCNMLMGNFKQELMGLTKIEISIPKKYNDTITDRYKIPDNHITFGFGFKYDAKEILLVDLVLFNWEV